MVQAHASDGERGAGEEPEQHREQDVAPAARRERGPGPERRPHHARVPQLRLLGDARLLEVGLEGTVELLGGLPLALELCELDGLPRDAAQVALVLRHPGGELIALGDSGRDLNARVGDLGADLAGAREP